MAYHLVIDIGNSSAKVALFEEATLVEHIRVEHEVLPGLLVAMSASVPEIDCAILSSVIPLSVDLEETIAGLPFLCLRMSSRMKMPFHIAYNTPETLGPDRLAAVAEAWACKPNTDLLVIDVGTAITYDVITSEGVYLGGNISPGIGMRFKALHHFTGKLPLVNKEGERVDVGNTTDTAIRVGVLQGVDKEIEGYIREYSLKYSNLLVFLTGGGANFLANRTKNAIFADNLLVVKGLNRILMLNK